MYKIFPLAAHPRHPDTQGIYSLSVLMNYTNAKIPFNVHGDSFISLNQQGCPGSDVWSFGSNRGFKSMYGLSVRSHMLFALCLY